MLNVFVRDCAEVELNGLKKVHYQYARTERFLNLPQVSIYLYQSHGAVLRLYAPG